jgi:hypothetical protein
MNTPIGTFHVSRPAVYGEQNLKVVLHTDHLASHAYDEAVERAAFEAVMLEEGFRATLEPDLDGVYMSKTVHAMWCGWIRCAKSRAKRAGGAE